MVPTRRLTFDDRLALGWGKLRRAYLITFHGERVRRSLARRVGHCHRTGACCRLMFECPALDNPEGLAACSIYVGRGPNCSLFPIDERDLRDRDRIMPGTPCGFRFVPEADFARLHPNGRVPRFVFPWEANGDALGGRVRRTNALTMALAFVTTAWRVMRRKRERKAAARSAPRAALRSTSLEV